MKNDWGFDLIKLRQICNMDIDDFMDGRYGDVYGPEPEDEPPATKGKSSWQWDLDGRHCFKDNGADILAVAHVDTVTFSGMFTWNGGRYVGSGQFDDRLGVYVITELLPSLGLKYDILLCTDEESGASTAADFYSDKQYNWIFEFDRKYDDVVLYQYWGTEWEEALKSVGFVIGQGSFSDINNLSQLGAKAVNIGVGYDNNCHSTSCKADLVMLRDQINKFLMFYEQYKDTYFPHDPEQPRYPAGTSKTYTYGKAGWDWTEDEYYDYEWNLYYKNKTSGSHKPEDLDMNFLYNRSHNRRWENVSGDEDMEWFYKKRSHYTHAKPTHNEVMLEKDGKRYFIDLRYEPIAPINLWEKFEDIENNYDEYIDWDLRDPKVIELPANTGLCPDCGKPECLGTVECAYCRSFVHDDEFATYMGMCEPCAKACGYDYEDLDNYRDTPVDEAWDH